jgi:TetR/AcrR family transcriptional regulator, transcriptional repressor for nem operon
VRYTDTHKDETHKRLLKIAAVQLREKGPERLGVADVMKAAGLTNGGFYAHFKSKDDLLVKAIEAGFAQAQRRVTRMVEGLPPRHALATYIDFYVSATHRDNPASGCAITALNSDLPRQSKKFRAAFEMGVKSLSSSLAGWMKAAGIVDAEQLAPSILAAMAGAVSLSRTISDSDLSDELLASTRAGIKARLGLTETALASEMKR